MTSWLRLLGTMLALTLSEAPIQAQTNFLPSLEEIGSGQEHLAGELTSALIRAPTVGSQETLDVLNNILERASEPNQLRGLVQFYRAELLWEEGDFAARAAVQESVRLLPGYSEPLFTAATILAYDNMPDLATDYLLRAGRIDPERLSRIEDYELNVIRIGLEQRGDNRRIRQLASRLFEIGWISESLSLRSNFARALIESHVEAREIEEARRLIPHLVAPEEVQRLLMQHRFETIWLDLERWAGPQQKRLWLAYLTELRARWEASGDAEAGVAYARALLHADHDETLIRTFLPSFLQSRIDPAEDYHLIWVSNHLSNALADAGRWAEMDSMYQAALAAWPFGEQANAINLAGNQARLQLNRGDPEAALAGLDAVISDSQRWSGQVSAGALATMHLYRACALNELGREAEALSSVAVVASHDADPILLARLHLCFDRHAAARDVLIAALEQEWMRERVIEFVQPHASPRVRSEYDRKIAKRYRALREDPALLAEVAPYGRILPYHQGAGAPPEEPEVKTIRL